MTTSHDVLRLDCLVATTPERMWEAWTTERGLATWWWVHWPGTTFSVDLRVGGSYRFEAAAQQVGVSGSYLEIEPHERLTFTWNWLEDGVAGDLERVEVTFAAEPDGVRVVVVHTGPWDTPEPAARYAIGWNFVLTALDGSVSDSRA